MIGLFLKIPFHAQIRRADKAIATELEAAVDEAVELSAAKRYPSDESYLLGFDEKFSALQAQRGRGSPMPRLPNAIALF